MNRKLLYISVVLIVIGLIGVSIVQSLWLKTAIDNRKADFDQRVYESLDEITHKIEFIGYHSYIKEFLSQIQNEDLDQVILMDSSSSTDSNLHHHEQDKDERRMKLRKQISDFQNMMASEMMSIRPIEEIIDTTQLRKLITSTLYYHGIKTEYQYGITEFADNNFIFVSKGANLSHLYHTEYTTKLFRNSFFDEYKLLKLTFPEKKRFLLQSFLTPIITFAVFMLMILVAFLLSFRVIFFQKRLSDIKADFINNMTHELKTPIATISLASEMLKDKSISSDEVLRLRYANVIYQENKRLSNHVEHVLQIAKLEKGELQLNKEDRDINDIVESVIHHFDLIKQDLSAEIITDLKANPAIVNIDEMHISNAIKNLIDNALKYNINPPVIEIKTYNEKEGVCISVKDNGIGLSKDEMKHIFDKFYRVQGGNIHNVKGFGLGLNYVKTIIDVHRGTINVKSILNQGTTFLLYLPYKA
ncbi:MAG: HAMP domain-containing histidine kinase [Chitinophagales bacterium]|nr:HAMP domain-containing histidine kinase [Chitinophagales bacterium]